MLPLRNAFAKFLEETYYRSISIDPMMTVERALSITRRQGRIKLQQLSSESKKFNSASIHYCFGAIKDKNLWLTHSGVLPVYLLHQFGRMPNGEARYRWVDLAATPLPRNVRANYSTLAASIISGPIGSHDTLILCTPSITDNIGLELLEKIITKRQKITDPKHLQTIGQIFLLLLPSYQQKN